MTKIEITDEMVDRAFSFGTENFNWSRHERIKRELRQVLNIALNPPPEPEVEVTEEMCIAGEKVVADIIHKNPSGDPWNTYSAIFRAMYAKMPKANK